MNKISIMGIVNVTPDSFSDGGNFLDPHKAIDHGMRLIEEGADILDIGGESTRPNALPVSVDEEIKRVVPVIKELSKTGKMISIDTRHTAIMRAAIEAGAGFVNDVNALRDQGAVSLAAETGVEICLMHMQGTPQTMQQAPNYTNVVEEVFAFLKARIDVCLTAGINSDKIYADVGIGFGKNLDHNISLLQNLNRFHDLGVKLLLGTSRKKFIENICGDATPDMRLGGSLASALWGVSQGVSIIRVHDVRETAQAVKLWESLSGQ